MGVRAGAVRGAQLSAVSYRRHWQTDPRTPAASLSLSRCARGSCCQTQPWTQWCARCRKMRPAFAKHAVTTPVCCPPWSTKSCGCALACWRAAIGAEHARRTAQIVGEKQGRRTWEQVCPRAQVLLSPALTCRPGADGWQPQARPRSSVGVPAGAQRAWPLPRSRPCLPADMQARRRRSSRWPPRLWPRA